MRYGGTFRKVRTMRAAMGSRLRGLIQKVSAIAARRLHAGGVGVDVDGQADAQVDEQRHANAGATVATMPLMCSVTDTPPTSVGTRIVVSESGDILSPT